MQNIPSKRQNGQEHSTKREEKNTGKKLAELSPKDKKWDEKKAGAQVVEGHYFSERQNPEHAKRAARMHDCANWLQFKQVTNSETGELKWKLAQAKFCCNRFCEVCMWRRSLRNVAKMLARLPAIFEQYPSPKYEWCFLTLTIPNVKFEDTRRALNDMSDAFRRLIKRVEFEGAVEGWVKTTEVTMEQGRAGYAHPHFHVLMLMKPRYFKGKNYITQERWLELWRECMRDDSITQVDIRKVKPNPKIVGQDLFGAVLETLKYGVKPADLKNSKPFLLAMTEQLHKLRFIDSGGALKGILKDEKVSNEEMIKTGDDEREENDIELEAKRAFSWNGKNYRAKS